MSMTDAGYDDFCFWLSILKRGNTAHGLREGLARYVRSIGWVWNIYRKVEHLSWPYSSWSSANFVFRVVVKRLHF